MSMAVIAAVSAEKYKHSLDSILCNKQRKKGYIYMYIHMKRIQTHTNIQNSSSIAHRCEQNFQLCAYPDVFVNIVNDNI